jgi:DNA-binding transcriptional ArsR family regulator
MIKHVDSIFDNENVLELLNAMSDPTRQQILMLFMSRNEYCVNEIAQQFSLSRPTVSHHLNLMRRSKLLASRKAGKEVYYSVNKDHVIAILESLLALLRSCC